MPAAIAIRTNYTASELRCLAASSKHANQSRRLLSDRQTLRDWVHRFSAEGPDGLKDIRSKGHPPRLTPEQLAAFAEIVATGPDRAKDGVVRWRRIDLKRVVEARFGVVYHERTIGQKGRINRPAKSLLGGA